MNSYDHNPRVNTSYANGNNLAKKQTKGSVFQLADNRASVVEQRKQQAMLYNGKQTKSFKDNSHNNTPLPVNESFKSDTPVQRLGWESLGPLNPRRYLPESLGGYTHEQMVENGLAAPIAAAGPAPVPGNHPVDYMRSSRARFARRFRRGREGITPGANVATMKLRRNSTGKAVYVTRKNQGYIRGGHTWHSEKMLEESRNAEFPAHAYAAESLYSERSPCDRPGYDCEHTSVPNILGPGGDVAYSFDYHGRPVNERDFQGLYDDASDGDASSEDDYSEYEEDNFDPLSGQFRH